MNSPKTNSADAIRTFVALSLPAEVKARIKTFQEELRRKLGNPPAFRWTDTGQLHLTLKFLGPTPVEAVPQVHAALEDAVCGIAPFELTAAGLGFFPTRRKPRVCWIGMEGDLVRLRQLQENVDQATAPWAPRETKPFSPHLTVARLKDIDPETLRRMAVLPEAMERCRLGDWHVHEVAFMKSELRPEGARHTRLGLISLPI